MATVKEINDYLNALLPRSLSCEWDNDGLMVCADPDAEVKTVLFALDVTPAVIDYAEKLGAELIISHHPLIFKGIKHVDGGDITSKKVIRLLKSGISVMSFHTRLDSAEGGVNDILAQALRLENVVPFDTEEGAYGRIGELAAQTSFEDFCRSVKEFLGAPSVHASRGKPMVKRVAVLGGAGKDDIFSAMRAGADAYVTGEASYHALLDASEMGFSVITAGHDFTENAFHCFFTRTLGNRFENLTFVRYPVATALYHI